MLRKLGTIAYGVYLIQGVMLVVAHGLMGKEASIKNFSDGLMTFAALIADLASSQVFLTIFLSKNHDPVDDVSQKIAKKTWLEARSRSMPQKS